MMGRTPEREALKAAAQARPRFEEVFELVRSAEDVPKALFRAEPGQQWVPYEVPYVRGRQGLAVVQQGLEDALADAGGRLLIAGRAGIGKTREVAEWAAQRCLLGWTLAVARPDLDARMGALAKLPMQLHDEKLVLIIDNLHARVQAAEDGELPYLERLSRCIDGLARQGLHDVRVVAIARDERPFQQALDLATESKQWREFGVFRMPDLTDDALSTILLTLAHRAELELNPGLARELVTNSDRTPRTIFINVDLARRKQAALGHGDWLPTEGETWRLKKRALRAQYPASDQVQAQLLLLARLGLPARGAYLRAMAAAAERPACDDALQALIDEGLVGRRQDRLTLFGHEQELDDAPAKPHADDWDRAIAAMTDESSRQAHWAEDLSLLALALLRADRPEQITAIASLAIAQGHPGAQPYKARSFAHFLAGRLDEAMADLASAIERDAADGSTWHMRGLLKYLMNDGPGVLHDMARAHELGEDSEVMFCQCGVAHYWARNWPAAFTNFSLAIDRASGGQPDGMLYFMRAAARQYSGDLAGAVADFNAALTHPSSYRAAMAVLPQIGTPAAAGILSATPQPLARTFEHRALVLGARAYAHALAQSWALAEADFTEALSLGMGDEVARMQAALSASALPFARHALSQMQGESGLLAADGVLLLGRAVVRRNQGKFDAALLDFASGLDAGAPPWNVQLERAQLYLQTQQPALAMADCDAVLAAHPPAAAVAHSLRGLAQIQQGELALARLDLDAAITQGRDDALVYLWRAGVRLDMQDAEGAQADAERALVLDGGNLIALGLRGGSLLAQDQYEPAEHDLSAAIERGGGDAIQHRWRGIARVALGQHAAAQEDFDAAIARGDTDPITHFFRGCARLNLHQPALAEADLDLALARPSPLSPIELHRHRGLARLAQDKHREAEADLSQAISLGGAGASVFLARAEAYRGLGETTERLADLQQAFHAEPESEEAASQLAQELGDQRQFAAALTCLDQALGAHPQRMLLLNLRAFICLQAGWLERAKPDLDTLIAQHPGLVSLHASRYLACYGMAELQLAMADLDAMVALEPAKPDHLADRVVLQVMLGQAGPAERDLAALQALNPAADIRCGACAAVALGQGRFDEAAALTQEAAAGASEASDWQRRLGLIKLLAGDVDAAQAAYLQGLHEVLPGNARIALMELDHWLARADYAGLRTRAQLIRERLLLACRVAAAPLGERR